MPRLTRRLQNTIGLLISLLAILVLAGGCATPRNVCLRMEPQLPAMEQKLKEKHHDQPGKDEVAIKALREGWEKFKSEDTYKEYDCDMFLKLKRHLGL